jgi:hypothetical protein
MEVTVEITFKQHHKSSRYHIHTEAGILTVMRNLGMLARNVSGSNFGRMTSGHPK